MDVFPVAGEEEEVKPARGSLKEFVSQFKDKHYHVIEMRILTVCSLAVFYKLFMVESTEEGVQSIVVSSSFILIACELPW